MEGGDIAVPSTFIIRQDREIVWQHIGERKADRPEPEEIVAMCLESAGPP